MYNLFKKNKKSLVREPSGQIITKYPKQRYVMDLTMLPDELMEINDKINYIYMFNIIGHFSKYGISFLIGDKTSKSILNKLKIVFDCYEYPQEICSDNGSEFKNGIVENFLNENKIKFIHGRPYNTHSQRVVERYHQTIKDMLYCFISDNENDQDLKESLEIVTKMYNNHKHSSTQFTPNEVFFLNQKFYSK